MDAVRARRPSQDPVWRLALLHPLHQRRQGIEILGADAATAVVDARHEEQPGERCGLCGATGVAGYEVINSVTEYKPGDELKLHIHHGEESAYVVQGATVQAPGKDPMKLPTGASLINLRNVPHGGFTIIGDSNLILFTVHIVEKGKTLYDAPK